MRAARYRGDGRFTVDEIEAVPPQAGEVQIRVAYTGICGTDLHVLHGSMDARVSIPQAIGHEMSGTVAALGEGVTGIGVGQQVTVMPLLPCDNCAACLAGNGHICQNLVFVGIDSPGSLQQLWNVPTTIVVPVPVSVSLEHAALVEPVAVACHDVRRSRLAADEFALVVGGGPIGQLIAIVARATGAQVLLSEPNAERRALAASLGTEAVDLSADALAALVESRTGGAGADVVFEVAGAAATALASVEYAKVRGRVVLVAIHPKPVPMNLHRVFWRELELLGVRVYERADFEQAVALLADGVIPARSLITRTVPLADTQAAFDELAAAGAMKILVDVQEG